MKQDIIRVWRSRGFGLGNEQGQAIVFVAILITVLFAFTALALDGALAYFQRTRLQAAADAGAAAGNYELVKNWTGVQARMVTDVLNAANTLAQANGLDPAQGVTITFLDGNKVPLNPQPTTSIPSSVRGLKVVTDQTYNTNFGKIIGWSTIEISGTAAALFGIPSNLSIFPMAVGGDALQKPYGTIFSLQPPGGSGSCGATCVNTEMFKNLGTYPTPPPTTTINIPNTCSVSTPLNCNPYPTVNDSQLTTVNYIKAMINASIGVPTDPNPTASCANPVTSPRLVVLADTDSSFNSPPENKRVFGFRGFLFTSATTNAPTTPTNTVIQGCWVRVNIASATVNSAAGSNTGVTTYSLVPPP